MADQIEVERQLMREEFHKRMLATGNWEARHLELNEDGGYRWADLDDMWFGYAAGYEAGERGMREKAVQWLLEHDEDILERNLDAQQMAKEIESLPLTEGK